MILVAPSVIVSAPGKLMLAGEYAVLEGAPALVAAVDRRVRARLAPAADPAQLESLLAAEWRAPGPEAHETRRLFEERHRAAVGTIVSDASALFAGDRKLGLGSSAATAAAVAGLLFHTLGRHLDDDIVRREALELALLGHRSVSPTGSGADVAAAVLGGALLYRVNEAPIERLLVLPSNSSVVFVGASARTSALVARVARFGERDRRGYERAIRSIANAASAMIDAIRSEDVPALIEATDAHGRAMAELGGKSGAPIVEERLERVAALARELGGAAKPSGAGGGDVAVAFFEGAEPRVEFEARCSLEGFTPLDVRMGAAGVRVEQLE